MLLTFSVMAKFKIRSTFSISVRVRVKIRNIVSVWPRCRTLFSVIDKIKLEFCVKFY